MTEPRIRPYQPEDRAGVISVIKSVYDDLNYAMDFEHFDADLADIDSAYRDAGGEFWVLADGAAVAGCVGVVPKDAETCELKRLYLARSYRRKGLGTRLVKTCEGWAIAHGFRRMILWSDVLLTAGHALYRKLGFTAAPETRAVDPTNPTSVERLFAKDL